MENQTNLDANNHADPQLPAENGASEQNEVMKQEEHVERLADLPLEERKKAIKQFYEKDWVTNARAGDFIDAVDTVQKWCLGQIVAIEDNQVTVRFDGWSNKYDSTYRFSSYKIAPFRKCSKGYTGQVKTQLRAHMSYNQDDIAELKMQIEGLVSNEFRGIRAYELTQFLRGKVFVYTDFVLSQVDYTEADYMIVNDFLKTVIKLIIAWMKHAPKIQQKALADFAKDSEFQLVDEDIAIFQSCGELMTTLQSILCGCHRTLKYYLYCDQNQQDFVAGVVKDYQKVDFVAHRTTISPTDLDIPRLMEKVMTKSQDLVYGLALDLLSSFHQQGGFDAYFSLLRQANTRPQVQDQNGKLVEDDKFLMLPLDKLGELSGAFSNCKALFDENFAITFVDQVHNIYKNRFLNITDKELKEIDKETLTFALLSLKAVLSLTKTPIETSQVIEEFQLLFVQRHLKTSYLEKRLQGVVDLRNLIEQVDACIKLEELKRKASENGTPPSQMPTYVITSNNKRIKPTMYLNQTSLKNWLIEMQILDNLFGEGAHPELLKRAAPIIKFLCQQNALTHDTVEAVWKCQQGKHEATVRIVYNLINEIVEDLPQELFDVLHQKIINVPQEEFTEMHLQFLKEFTIKAYAREESTRQITEQMQEEADIQREKSVFSDLKAALEDIEKVCLQPGQKLYGLPIYWRVLQDSFKCNDLTTRVELFKVAQESMIDILNLSQARSALMFYLLKCINNLYEGQSLYPSITLLQNILGSMGIIASQQIYERDPLTTHKAICQLEMQLGLVQLVMKVINHYDSQVKETVKNLGKKGKSMPDKIEKYVFSGCSEHNATLDKIFEFLEFVVLSSNWAVVIQAQNLQSLFQIFVHAPNFQSDQVLFLQFINKKRQKSTEGNSYNKVLVDANLLTGEEQKHLFSQILCNPEVTNYVQLTSGLSKCFQTFFKLINQELGYLEVNKRVEIFNFESLIGMESLWRITVECSNEKVRDVSRDLLIDLHLRLNNATFTQGDKERIRQIFIDRCMLNLQSASGPDRNTRSVTAVVKALTDFLDRYDGNKQIKPELKTNTNLYQNYPPWTINVIYRKDPKGNQQEGQIQVSQFETLGSVRSKCAAAFGLEINEFHLRLKQGVVDPEEDDDSYVKDYGLSPQIFLLPNPNYDKVAHPKFLLALSQAYFDLLLNLLAQGDSGVVESVWTLLEKLPVNAKLQDDIINLRGTEDSWEGLLDSRSTHKLLYSLKIIEGLTSQNNDVANIQGQDGQGSGATASLTDLTQWKHQFIQKGGFEHLLNTFTGLKLETIDSKLTVRCIQSLLTTILDFVQLQSDLGARIFARREAVVIACLRYLHLISLYSLLVEQQRGESLEDLKARQTQKRLAKIKMKQLQQVGPQRKNANQDNDSDAEQGGDELQIQINSVITEFGQVRIISLKLFSFMSHFVFGTDNDSRALVLKYPQLQELIEVSLLKTENYALRMLTLTEIQGLLIACSQQPSLNQTLTSILHTMLFTLLPKAPEYEKRCGHFFSLLRAVLSELKLEDLIPLEGQLWSLAQSLTQQISQWQVTDVDSKNDDNNVLAGWMGVLKVLMQKYPIRKKEVGSQLVKYLLEECLFKVPQGSGIGMGIASQPKCKSHASRQAALSLLAVLSRDSLENLRVVLSYITEFSKSASWRTFKQSDWAITHQNNEKSSTGYVGLKNLGCICYMCSLFQQLFMIPSFRDDLLSVEDPNHNDVEPDENMFYQLQAVFAGLQRSEKQYVNPKGFCHAYKDWDGNPTNVLEQVDVEEFLSLFLDRLEAAIQQTPQEKTVQTHFGGKFAGQTICKGCPHSYEQRSEPFLSLSVPVKNKRSVQEGLTAFIQGEMLEGDNAYFCEQCSKKVDALKRTCVKELPRYLILTLKRFEWDLDRGTRVKINDYCEFPLELDMLPYTQEGLTRKEKEAQLKQEAAEKGEEAGETEAEEPLKHDRKYYQFKLKGVVVHSGTADSGHYYSFIREPASADHDKWYEFNDHIVRDFDIADLPKECFGGEDSFFGPGMMQLKTQKMRNAYVLMYERLGEGNPEPEASEAPLKEIKKKDENQHKPKLLDSDHPIQQNIMLENQKYWQNKYLFGTEYFDFVTELVNYWDTANIIPLRISNKNQDEHIVGYSIERPGVDKSQLHQYIQPPADQVFDLSTQHESQVLLDTTHEVFKFTAKFFLTILQRSSLKGHVPRIVNAMKSYINYDKRNGIWLIEEFSNWYILEEMMFQVKNREMSKIICGLLYCSMLTVYDDEKKLLADYWPPSGEEASKDFGVLGQMGNFVLLLLSHMYNMKHATINLPHYFRLLARFASLGPEAREFLLRAQIVGRCMDFYFDGASPYREEFSDMSSLGNIRVKEQPDIGLPTSLGQKIRGYFQVLQEKKRRQELIARPDTIRYNQLIELVSLCVRHIKLGESPFQLDQDYSGSQKSGPCVCFVNSKESDIFIPEARFLKRIFADARKNRSMNALVKAHCHYASPDSDQVQELFKTVEFGFNDSDFDTLRPFLFLLETLLETDHPTFEKRRASWLKKFLEIVKVNSSFYKWMETIFEFIFKIVGRNPYVREWFSQNTSLWKFLIEWAQQNPKAPHPAQTTSTGTRLLKVRTNINIIQQYNDPDVAAQARLTASYRMRKLSEMIQNNVKDTSGEIDTDRTDYLDFKFYPGDLICLYSRKRDEASYWRVLVVLDELLNIQCVQPDSDCQHGQTKWQFCDTDKLLLGDIYRNLSRTQILSEILERSQAQNQRLYQNSSTTGVNQYTQGSSGQQQRPIRRQLNDDLANVEDSNDEVESSDDTHNAVSNIVQ